MICIRHTKKFCKDDITKIENYDKAIADDKTWCIHHRLETHKYKDRNRKEWVKRDEDVSKEMLQAFGLYYNRPAEELIFMTKREHSILHRKGKPALNKNKIDWVPWNKGKKGAQEAWNKGKCMSEEFRQKVSEAQKGKPGHNKGKHWALSEETKQKVRESRKGKPTWHKGKNIGHWYNNGTISIISQECPEGFVPGRIYKRKKQSSTSQ